MERYASSTAFLIASSSGILVVTSDTVADGLPGLLHETSARKNSVKSINDVLIIGRD
jgi:hypothetical protein